ncbi:GH92 family glycosyl hydrolase [Dactylosporangium siamense]|uniref:Alpha-1,2-mannosidase n=1 Tax=Dactylosporangium siamense TaxID=685454 RepID=A0A919UHB7_9ACTN|nr:GH92 family glycosyl hydrolase [Dactylosporangium siamense]GIG52241.1 alpha-1,2-mannosidase [Dactylosporangium siamense]
MRSIRGGRSLVAVALLVGAAVAPLAGSAPAFAVTNPAGYVNTLVGTNGGETFPGADTPYGMVQWSPENTAGNQTRTVRPGGYGYSTTRTRGFSLTHMSGTGCAGGSGDIPFMPYVGTVGSSPSADTTDATYASSFSHANETATAGYYRVGLNSGVNTELTATTRTGAGRFTYPTGSTATMLVRTSNSEVGSSAATVNIDAASRTISGSVTSGNFCGYINAVGRRSYYTLHFTAVFDKPFSSVGTWQDGTLRAGTTSASGGTTYGTDGWPVAGRGSGGYVTFDLSQGTAVGVRVGISYVSQANAQANLAAENPAGTTFDTVRQRATDAWNTELGRIDVSGGTTAQLQTFYTALYHALLHPNVFSDVNGQYTGMDQQVHTAASGHAQYANFSGWDVYRGQVQLVTLLRPDVGADIAQSLLNQATQNGGVWDRWTHNQGGTHVMTGDPAHAAVPSIYAFGGTGFDAAGALTSMVHAATTVTAADLSRDGWNVMVVGERPSLDKWLSINYIPTNGNAWGGAGETLEVSVADFGVSQLAARLGSTATASQFLARSQYWKNVFNPGNGGYIQDRNDNGTWPSFSPGSDSGFAEGSAAQYTWMIPHNVRGLFDRMGGNATAVSRLDSFFHNSDGSWALTGAGGTKSEMDNEPSIWVPWLYNFAGRPDKAQQTIRQTLNALWAPTPTGIPGQDDLGAMSAWYVWSAMGIHPLTPGRSELLVSAPLFPGVTVNRGNGKTISITAPGAATYVQSLTVNGTASNRAWLPESFVANGGTLAFTVGTTASSWGSALADAPPSFDVASGSPNLALNRPATGSASCNANESPAKAVNGTVSGGTSDKFCSTAATKYLQVDLGSAKALTSVTVRHAGAGGESTSWNTRDFDLQVSSDGTTWSTVAQVRGNTASVSSHTFTATARYVRMNVIAAEQGSGGATRIYEFEVY